MVGAGGLYRLFDWEAEPEAAGPRGGQVEALAGVRVTELRTEINGRHGLPKFDDDKTWVDPIVGLQGRAGADRALGGVRRGRRRRLRRRLGHYLGLGRGDRLRLRAVRAPILCPGRLPHAVPGLQGWRLRVGRHLQGANRRADDQVLSGGGFRNMTIRRARAGLAAMVALAPLLALAGCESFGRGVTQAVLEERTSDRRTRATARSRGGRSTASSPISPSRSAAAVRRAGRRPARGQGALCARDRHPRAGRRHDAAREPGEVARARRPRPAPEADRHRATRSSRTRSWARST